MENLRNWYGADCCTPHTVIDTSRALGESYARIDRMKCAEMLARHTNKTPPSAFMVEQDGPFFEVVGTHFEITTRLAMQVWATVDSSPTAGAELKAQAWDATQAFADFYRPFLVLKTPVRLSQAVEHALDVDAVARRLIRHFINHPPADSCEGFRWETRFMQSNDRWNDGNS